MTLSLAGVRLCYGNGTPALDALDLHVAPGEQLAVIGPSGAGKSSLLHLPATAQRPGQGSVNILGQDVMRLRGSALRSLRARIGLVQQSAPLPPRQRVINAVLATHNLEQAIERAGSKQGNKGFEAAVTALEMVSLLKKI